MRWLFKNFLQADVIGSTLDMRGLCGITYNVLRLTDSFCFSQKFWLGAVMYQFIFYFFTLAFN